MIKILSVSVCVLVAGLASAQVGINTLAPNSTLDVNGSLALKTSIVSNNTSLDDTYQNVICDNPAAITITLPTAVGITGRSYTIKRINTGSVMLATSSLQTIDGASSLSLASQYDLVAIVSNGMNWNVMGQTNSGSMAVVTSTSLTGAGTIASPLGLNLNNANSWTANQTFGNGIVLNNSNLSIANNTNVAGELRLSEPSSSGTNYAAIKSPALPNNATYTLPGTVGTAGQALKIASSPAPTATSATLQWASTTASAQLNYQLVSSNTMLSTTDEIVGVVVGLSATVTLTLPPANSVPAGKYYLINIETLNNPSTVVVATSGGDLVDNASTKNLNGALRQGLFFYSNGINQWHTN